MVYGGAGGGDVDDDDGDDARILGGIVYTVEKNSSYSSC